ncbi:MAG: hypothetical protein L3J22_11360 [Xanthomonadales bacterium]|nr:hypothetical protein [Xanthomonadales bacterium]
MKTICKLFQLTALLVLPTIALALTPQPPTDGPVVPCVGCESLTAAPYPESGLWSNPEKSPGSGLNFEIQNGTLAGYLYSYTDEGKPEWLIVSGQLVRSETEGVTWELDTRMTRVEGGSNYNDQQFIPPDQITSDKRILLEFKQRNYLHIKIYTDNLGLLFDEYFVPFTYGSVGKAYFDQQTPYIFPEFGANSGGSLFIVTVRPSAGAEDKLLRSQYVSVLTDTTGTAESTVLTYSLQAYEPNGPIASPTPLPWGKMICEIDLESASPGCKIEAEGITYQMPIGNLSDSRFFAEAEDGSIIEGFRFDYD